MMQVEADRGPGVAVVTGGATGIGLASVDALLDAGWKVAFFSQTAERVQHAVAQLTARHPASTVHGAAVDLRDEAAVTDFFDHVRALWGSIEALVCNAGQSPKGPGGKRRPTGEIPLEEWEDVLRVNLTGAFLCCRQVLPAMQAAGRGRIVLVGSLAARTLPRIAGASYVASKAALAALARSIVSDYAASGITANTICPGRILSEMTGPPDAPGNRAALERIPAGRLGRPEDIARVVEFLLRRDSDFINGAIIDVNGGEFVPA